MNKNEETKKSTDVEKDLTDVDRPPPVSYNNNCFRHFANIAIDLFWETDTNLCFTYVAEGYGEMTGVPMRDVLGKSRKELLGKFLDDDICEQHFKLLDQRLPYCNLVYQWRSNDGRRVIIKSWGFPYFDRYGVFLGYRGIDSDITRNRIAQLALKVSEERFQAFAEIAADLFWETDKALRFTYLSDRYEEVTGVPPEKVLGMTRQEFLQNMLSPEQYKEHEEKLQAHEPYDDLLYNCKMPGGRNLILSSSARPFYDLAGNFCGYRGVARDVTASYEAQEKMIYYASHDDLTGLVNRREFQERFEKVFLRAKSRLLTHVLCYLDLDQFKIINDTAGHQSGDNVLREISALIQRHIRQRDTLARLGGDEFGLLIENCTADHGKKIAEKLVEAINAYEFRWEGCSFKVGVSIGLVPINNAAESTEQLLSQADAACYTAKNLGRNCVYVYRPESDGLDWQYSEIIRAAELKDALSNNRFTIVAQQIVPLRLHHNVGKQYEVLLRLPGENGHYVSPDKFIPAAERYGLMPMIDRYVFDKTLTTLAGALKSSKITRVNINISAKSLIDNTLFEYVANIVHSQKISPESICFEITETALINNLSSVAELIRAMKTKGFQFALDDFGSGFSSLAYIKTLPVNFLKIEGTFVRNIVADSRDCAIVKAITEMSHSMGIETVAECAESEEIVQMLKELGVDWVQGYVLTKVLPIQKIV